MKTPTLIVRLVGLYLLVQCSITLVQIRQIHSMGLLAGPQQSSVGDIQLDAILGLIAGTAGALFAGPLARLLTFDAKPRTTQSEITEKLLQPKG